MASLGAMVASVSHEIKNPLGIIRSTSDLLEKKVKQYDPDNRLASVIREESDRLNRVVTEFLDFARPQVLRFQPVALDQVLEKNIQFLETELSRQGIVIEKSFPSSPVVIQGDQDLLYRGFLNILINALQAMPEGGTLSLTIRNQRREVEVEVRDSGAGLPEEARGKAFDPFFTTKEKGTGLGLAIVKNTIEAHNGSIELENYSGGGTTVHIRLPREPSGN